ARAPQHGAAPHLGEGVEHDRLRHALDPRGSLPLDARRRDVGAAGTHRRHRRHRLAAAADGRDAGGSALLRARHRGARDARRPRPAHRGSRGALLAKRLKDWLPAIVVFALGIGLWQGLTAAFHVQTFLLPKPSQIATSLWDNKSPLWHAGLYTLKE